MGFAASGPTTAIAMEGWAPSHPSLRRGAIFRPPAGGGRSGCGRLLSCRDKGRRRLRRRRSRCSSLTAELAFVQSFARGAACMLVVAVPFLFCFWNCFPRGARARARPRPWNGPLGLRPPRRGLDHSAMVLRRRRRQVHQNWACVIKTILVLANNIWTAGTRSTCQRVWQSAG